MNYELKPCPFCGGTPFEGHTGKLNYTIKCHECGLTMEHDRIDKVRGEWNKRNGKYPIEQDQPSGEGMKVPKQYLEGFNTHMAYKQGKPDGGFINLLPTEVIPVEDAIKALTAQARDYEREMEAFVNWVGMNCNRTGSNEWDVIYGVPEPVYGLTFDKLRELFRNDRSKPKE